MVYVYLPVVDDLNLDATKVVCLNAGFSVVPAVFLVNPHQLCWAGFIVMLQCVFAALRLVCICVGYVARFTSWAPHTLHIWVAHLATWGKLQA